ncbi:low temperature requirement protein A [Pseudoclavibacter chungangensis]|uniref:Low temperature requirement protein A n=2 Tax=Pseudoclavibacter chungangensis TaxID=587635 RepID=A0A7J5BP94_9MICO|nr:low temperature requirement protein A [Pseudoclavibacter chungangensis]
MRPRDPAQPHRASSPLEAFFDLVFVVAVSLASGQLHHHETSGDLLGGVIAYLMVFFAIWWAWMNFTWFATSFDVDDWLYRLMTIVQMGGALVMAAGAPAAMNEGDFRLLVVGYLIMRLALVPQWLRAAAQSADYRRTALSYAVGIVVVQALWVAWLWLPGELRPWVFLPLVVLELLVPVVAERRQRRTPWHPEHIAERSGLFTLIVLGESVLASTNAVVDAVDHVEHLGTLVGIAACGLVLAAWLQATLPTAAVLMVAVVVTLEISRRSDRAVEG